MSKASHGPTCWDCGAANDVGSSECWLCHRRDWDKAFRPRTRATHPDPPESRPLSGIGGCIVWITILFAFVVSLVIAVLLTCMFGPLGYSHRNF
jgi:hypothetical protein